MTPLERLIWAERQVGKLARRKREVEMLQMRIRPIELALAYDGSEKDAQINRAICFLSRAKRTQNINKRAGSCYGLKHEAERWGKNRFPNPYISTASFIAAAILLGFKVQHCDGHWDAFINISNYSLRNLY